VDKLEKKIKQYAIYNPDDMDFDEVNVTDLLSNNSAYPMSSGMNARVFRVSDSNWVLKEGRWDLDLALFGNIKLLIPAKPVESVLKLFQMTFLPTKEEIIRQYKLYLIFCKFFGYFDKETDYYHPEINIIRKSQKDIRSKLFSYKNELEKYYNFQINSDVLEIFADEKLLQHNFLPKEYLLYGKSISPENKNNYTYYIVQEYIDGILLHDYRNINTNIDVQRQLWLLAYLILLLKMLEGIVPDTRPRYMITESYDWLAKTDNIIIKNNYAKFIDTRWFWTTNDNLVKRGIFIPELTIKFAKKYLQ
jgi:hypothetical protein